MHTPDSKVQVHGANMGPIWGRQDPGGPHVGPMNFAIWDGNSDGDCGDFVTVKSHNLDVSRLCLQFSLSNP